MNKYILNDAINCLDIDIHFFKEGINYAEEKCIDSIRIRTLNGNSGQSYPLDFSLLEGKTFIRRLVIRDDFKINKIISLKSLYTLNNLLHFECMHALKIDMSYLPSLSSLYIKDDKKIKELKILEDKLNKEIKGLEDEIVVKKAEVKSLNIEKNNLKENINTLKEEYSKKLNEKNTEISILNDEKENLKNTYRKLESDLKNDIETKRNEIIDLKRIEEDLKDKKSKLTAENKSLENKLNNVKEEFEIVKSEIRKERESIGDLLQAKKLYNKYLSMETRILSKLDNVLIQRDFESFLSSGYSLSSLDNVWDIVKIEYRNISNEDKEILKEVFAFFLSQINKRFKEAKYGLVQVEVGEDFDAVNQVDLSQNSRGRVTECVFYGYGFLKEKEDSNEEDVVIRIIKSPLVLTA